MEAKFFEIVADSPAAQAVFPWLKNAPANVVEVFAAEQAVALAAVLGATRGIDLLAAPGLTTRSEQQAVVEIVREVRHPIDWKRNAKSGGWEPSHYATKNLGVTLGVLGKVRNADAIDVTLRPEAVEFVGFQDLDAPGLPIKLWPATAKPLAEWMLKPDWGEILPTGHRAKAVFATRKTETIVTVRPGESVLLELDTPPVPSARKRRVFTLVAIDLVKLAE